MIKTQYARILDSSGRLVIPSKLRAEMNLQIGQIYDFYKYEADGKVYLCIECPEVESEIEKAKRILKENGIDIP